MENPLKVPICVYCDREGDEGSNEKKVPPQRSVGEKLLQHKEVKERKEAERDSQHEDMWTKAGKYRDVENVETEDPLGPDFELFKKKVVGNLLKEPPMRNVTTGRVKNRRQEDGEESVSEGPGVGERRERKADRTIKTRIKFTGL
ncbi:hypothetical protein AGIG_G21505 [Arapaima gigas]